MKPVLFVTNHAPADRLPLFARLHEREDVEFVLFGGPSRHGVATPDDHPTPTAGRELGFPHRQVSPRELGGLIGSGRHRAVICSTGGRIALPLTWSATRAARLPLILWTSLWAHPRSVAHAFSYRALVHLYRSAEAIVTYGPHVSAYVRARGARNVYVAPQAVDNDFWSAPESGEPPGLSWPPACRTRFLFVGRPAREKGVQVLTEAWKISGLRAPSAALVLVGMRRDPVPAHADGAADIERSGEGASDRAGRIGREHDRVQSSDRTVTYGGVDAATLRRFYARADVLVVPSIRTATFREPWGLVVNEAMNQHVAIISSDAVGAAAGGLVRDRHNGLIFASGDADALARSLRELALDRPLRERLATAGCADVRVYTADAWASGFSAALASLGRSRSPAAGPGAGGPRTVVSPAAKPGAGGPGTAGTDGAGTGAAGAGGADRVW